MRKPELKQMLLAASSKALKTSQVHLDAMESYINIHKSCNLTPQLYNDQLPEADWIELLFNQILTSRQSHFKISKSNVSKIGNNKLATRLSILNGKIPLKDLNMTINSFKLKYKNLNCIYKM